MSDAENSCETIAVVLGNVISETKYREASRATQWRVGKACPLRLRYGMLREGEVHHASYVACKSPDKLMIKFCYGT